MIAREELAELCVSGRERMERVLAGKDVAVAIETSDRLIAAMRAFCTVYLDWLVLTDDYVLDVLGHDAHVRATRPERAAEMALRTGLTLDDLVAARALVADDQSALQEEVREAIRSGDGDRALELWLEGERLLRDVHDLRRDLISDALGQIYTEYGAEGLEAAQFYAAERGWWKESMPADFALEPRTRLEEVTFMLTVGAFSDLWVTEEEEAWVIHQRVCGNCGRQVRDRYQADEDWGLPTVKGPAPMTFGQAEMTVYQTHLAVIHHMYAIDLVGAPWPSFRCVGLDQAGGHCQLIVYKDPARTAPEFFEMVGRSRPGA